jgi:hypothetical protein
VELLAKEVKEVDYILKLTQTELNTMLVGFGATSHGQRESKASIRELKILNMTDSQNLYDSLCDIAESGLE